MPDLYNEINLVDDVTADGDYPTDRYLMTPGDISLGFYGTFGAATVQFVFFTETTDGSLVELPTSTDFEFTAAPEPQVFRFPQQMPYKVRVSGADGSTNLGINAHPVR